MPPFPGWAIIASTISGHPNLYRGDTIEALGDDFVKVYLRVWAYCVVPVGVFLSFLCLEYGNVFSDARLTRVCLGEWRWFSWRLSFVSRLRFRTRVAIFSAVLIAVVGGGAAVSVEVFPDTAAWVPPLLAVAVGCVANLDGLSVVSARVLCRLYVIDTELLVLMRWIVETLVLLMLCAFFPQELDGKSALVFNESFAFVVGVGVTVISGRDVTTLGHYAARKRGTGRVLSGILFFVALCGAGCVFVHVVSMTAIPVLIGTTSGRREAAWVSVFAASFHVQLGSLASIWASKHVPQQEKSKGA